MLYFDLALFEIYNIILIIFKLAFMYKKIWFVQKKKDKNLHISDSVLLRSSAVPSLNEQIGWVT